MYPEIFKNLCKKGDTQIRTGDRGFADPGLTTWLCRHFIEHNKLLNNQIL